MNDCSTIECVIQLECAKTFTMLLFNRYEYNPQTDLIGKGGFARVYKALDKKLNRKIALKIYKPSELSGKYSPIAEIQRVIELDHPNITRYIDIEEIEREDSFGEKEKIQVCVMELLEGGNLHQYFNLSKDLLVFKKLLIDVLNGLSYLHRNGITHRDIKPSNILIKNSLDGPIAKITDFGISKKSDADNNNTASALIVSIPYMAPEQLNAQKYGINGKAGQNIDFWSLGVAVFEVITGEVLFRNSVNDSSEQVMSNILSSRVPKKLNVLPEPYKSFVSQCIVKDAKARVSRAEELAATLEKNVKSIAPASSSAILPKKNTETSDNLQTNNEALAQTVVLYPTNSITTDAETKMTDETTVISGIAQAILSVKHELLPGDDTGLIDQKDFAAKNEKEEATAGDITQVIDSTIAEEISGLNETKIIGEMPGDETTILSVPKIETSDSILTNTNVAPVMLFNRYEYRPHDDIIGKGGFSRVYKAFDHKLGRWVALKIYKTSEYSDRYSPIAEIKRVVNLDHPNICRYLDIEELEKTNPFGETEKIQVCVMELLDGGNIGDYYRSNHNVELLKKLVQDILFGISYLHKKGIIHRDIKPANILIKENVEGPVAKITDFGISKGSDSANTSSSSALIVSIPFMAPEQFNPKKYGINGAIGANLDLWSLGVTLYEVITGKVLFKDSDQDTSEQIMANIMSPEVPEKINELPEPFRSVVSSCLVKDARKRAQKAEELLPMLNKQENTLQEEKKRIIEISDTNVIEQPFTRSIQNGKQSLREEEDAGQVKSAVPKKARFVIENEQEEIKEASKWNLKVDYKKVGIAAGVAILLLIIFLLLRASTSKNQDSSSAQSVNSGSTNVDSLFGLTVAVLEASSSTVSNDSIKVPVDQTLSEENNRINESNDPSGHRSPGNNNARNNHGSRNPEPNFAQRFTLKITTASTCVVKFGLGSVDTLIAGASIKYHANSTGTYQVEIMNLDGTLRTADAIRFMEIDRGKTKTMRIR